MTNSIQDHLANNLRQAKATSGNRFTRIRDIFKAAATQAITEVKEGTGEVRTLLTDSYAIAQEKLAATTADPHQPADAPPKPLFALILQRLRQQVSGQVQQQAAQVQERLQHRYGDRYATVQQRLQRMGNWYRSTKAKAEQQGIDPLQQKQTQVETKAAAAGVSVAQTEQHIRQQAKDWLRTVIAKS
ncbi:MAG: hypothetical protein WCD18_03280 [Thermosynechococcaceae cyanobacterium]